MDAPAAAEAPGGPPIRRRAVVTSSTMTVLEPIRFVGATATIDPRSEPMLDALAETFQAHPDLELIEVRAYGPDAPAGAAQRLGLARAIRIAEALAARGVAPARLVPVGEAAPPAGSPATPELRIVRRRSDLRW